MIVDAKKSSFASNNNESVVTLYMIEMFFITVSLLVLIMGTLLIVYEQACINILSRSKIKKVDNMKYTRKKIIEDCRLGIKNPNTMYTIDAVNYTGTTSDTKEYYSEIVAEFIIDNLAEFNAGIPVIHRESSYNMMHSGKRGKSDREENLAIDLFAQSVTEGDYDHIGKILDYQIPLKNKEKDTAGKIDLLSVNGSNVYILELKKPDSRESMLRCILEGYTYYLTVDKEKLLSDFGLPADSRIMVCPFVFVGSRQYNEMKETRPKVSELMKLLDIKPYYISKENGKFIVVEG